MTSKTWSSAAVRVCVAVTSNVPPPINVNRLLGETTTPGGTVT
jgi:hypothetical protein